MITRIRTFFKEVWTETKKVDWPSRQDTLRYTVLVIAISFVVASFLGFLDFIFFRIIRGLFF